MTRTPAEAFAAVTVFDSNALAGDLLQGFSAAQLTEIANWDFAAGLPAFALTVTPAGSGGGTVTSTNPPGGIGCGIDCVEAYPAGTAVTLQAQQDDVSLFAGWSGGGCGGTGACTVTVSQATTVTATFVRLFTLTVQNGGGGTVGSAPGGIACGGDCAGAYPADTPVTLTAMPGPNLVFQGWSGGGCIGTDPCVVVLTADTTVAATFAASPLPPGVTVPLVVTKTGAGSGAVSSVPGGIACDPDCVEAYAGNTVVALVAVPAAGSLFAGFGGDTDCADGVVTMTGTRFCTARFIALSLETASVGPGGAPVIGESQNPVMSADGRFVAFDSTAAGLVASPCSGGGIRQVFVRDRAGATECVSVGPNGQGNLPSARPSISADGRFVAFESTATNLDPARCALGGQQIFVRDRTAGTTSCVSTSPGGSPGNAPSADAALSGDGRLVAFQSNATNLGECSTGVAEVFVRDRTTGTTECGSVGPGGAPGNLASSRPVLNADGTVLVFESSATNLVAAPGCTTGGFQIFLRDRVTRRTECVSVGPDGSPGDAASADAAVSEDGHTVAFRSTATNLSAPCTTGVPQAFVRSRAQGVTRCVSLAPDGTPGGATSTDVVLSGDGRFVAFTSSAANLVGGGGGSAAATGVLAQGVLSPQVFRMNLSVQSNVAELLSQSGGQAGNGASSRPALNRTGSVTAFQSQASNLRPGSANALDDVLVAEQPEVTDPPRPPNDRPILTAPANGASFPLLAPTAVGFQWTGIDGAAAYGFEFTGRDQSFTNANGTGPDTVNGFGGGGGGFPTTGTGFVATLDPTVPAGRYQVRVIGLGSDGLPRGSFSDALTLFLGAAVPPTARPTITGPANGTTLTSGSPVTFLWTETVPGVPQYLFEVSGPGRPFANPNGTAADPGAIGFLVPGTVLPVVVPPGIQPGTYQVRVIGVSATGQALGSFSNAITLIVQ
jgi:hypothetical protein